MAKVKVDQLCSDLQSCVGKGNTYGKPECLVLSKLKAGGQKVQCAGLIVAAVKGQGGTLYNGTNTIWRTQIGECGSVSDHKSTNGYPKNVNPLKSSQLKKGMAVFKWECDGEPSKYSKDGKGNYCHIGIVTSTNPLHITHCSSEEGQPIISKSIGKFCAWAKLNTVDYGETTTTTKTSEEKTMSKVTGGTLKTKVGLNVRSGAGKTCSRIGGVAAKKVFAFEGDPDDEWVKISTGTISGYINCADAYVTILTRTYGDDSNTDSDSGSSSADLDLSDDVSTEIKTVLNTMNTRIAKLEAKMTEIAGAVG